MLKFDDPLLKELKLEEIFAKLPNIMFYVNRNRERYERQTRIAHRAFSNVVKEIHKDLERIAPHLLK